MKVTREGNFRVIVTPRSPGDYGFAHISGQKWDEGEERRACEEVADQIRRHVDGLPSASFNRSRGVDVECDTVEVCSFCGYEWELDENGVPACCDKAVAEHSATED